MTTKPKRPPGRPAKSPGQKLEQFSIRLPTRSKLGLDLLARLRGASLSDAIAYLIARALQSEKHGELSIGKILDQVFIPGTSEGEFHQRIALFFPELATPQERYIGEIERALLEYGIPKQPFDESSFWGEVWEAAKADFEAGVSAKESAQRWYSRFDYDPLQIEEKSSAQIIELRRAGGRK